ncbi:MAG: M4 family metallopeptidase [Nannocystis sp.]|uniref:M4 family metallopeptidase n=1 Tax=Nannocystis sp. TaxID=1962667 RepID=UPI00242503D5|nr:M4 family metallopeptidase [Nannocystis sp.]MBK9752588.1 M4 family metallopeptidase [Nannocystis sp.]
MEKRGFRSVRYVAAERDVEELGAVEPMLSFATSDGGDEEVGDLARQYLDRVLELEGGAGLSFGVDAEPAPELTRSSVQASPLSNSSVVRFAQASGSIPIFGSHMLVEVGADGKLVGVEAELAAVQGTSPTPTLAADEAAARIAALAEVDPAVLQGAGAPGLTYYHDDEVDRWHLVWFFHDLAVAPAGGANHEGHAGHARRGHGGSPRHRVVRFNYLVDAHDGEVVFHYSSAPRARGKAHEQAAIPSKCQGLDALGEPQEFFGQVVAEGYELSDPMRRMRTFDIAGGDISASPIRLPKQPIRHAGADFGGDYQAAVSAHVNVGRVLDFYRSILMRDSVDDKGMEIISVVNCISSDDEDPPDWSNATWWDGRMWYGQMHDAGGQVRSFAAFLDVIAHELTHGVIEHTADLIYKGESGALNESLCDIFAMIIGNWYRVGADSDPAHWSWEFGPGLGGSGKPIRDLSDPGRTGDPDHMSRYLKTREDEGGVHTNSNIHNKAAYFLITGVDGAGKAVISPREAAILYYMCLLRLPQRATFARTLRGLVDVARSYFAAAERERKVAAIEAAYGRVGISLVE